MINVAFNLLQIVVFRRVRSWKGISEARRASDEAISIEHTVTFASWSDVLTFCPSLLLSLRNVINGKDKNASLLEPNSR